MFTTPEQFSSIAKSTFETQLALFTNLSSKAFESMEKVVDLNLNAAKASIEDSTATAKQLLSAKDPQEVLSLTASQAQPAAAKAIAYGRHLANIATSAQADFTRIAEEQIAEAGRKVSTLVEDASKAAPAGSENVFALVRSALDNANTGYEQLNRAGKQAAEAFEANMSAAVNQLTQTAEKATGRTRAK